jgi:tetratricopeptide (TPR) repeat protein
MKYVFLTTALLLTSAAAVTSQPHGPKEAPAVLLKGLSDLHHPVSTKNAEAQAFFDQGLRLLYAFNHDEAKRSFQRAAELDPNLAMAHWGIALAVGPNYNVDADVEQRKLAYQAIQQAIKLNSKASEPEKGYINALAQRYAEDPKADKTKLGLAYKNAMGVLSKRYPDDLDAATLYAESAMNLRPWDLWSLEGKPREGTEEIVSVLESVLRRNPDHIGANHYYIHAIEASLTPERGLEAARRLGGLAPGAGHLVHMPAHIYHRVGDYAAAAESNEKAAAADLFYILAHKVRGIYPMMYYSHNLHFLAVAHAMQGRHADAKKAAEQLSAHVGPHVKDMPMLEGFMPTPILIDIRFRRWDDIVTRPEPDSNQKFHRCIWHFGRGLAFAHRKQDAEAKKELQALNEIVPTLPMEAAIGERNAARTVLAIPQKVLAAQIDLARDPKDKNPLGLLKQVIDAEDALNYIEPADWYLHVRETLGGALLRAGQADEAEKVFRADLERNRRNGRSLFGLMKSLEAQGKMYEAQAIRQQFETAWRNADAEGKKLRVEDL